MDLSISGLISLHGFFTLGMLIVLQAVLGFDNLLYISFESKRVPKEKQSYVRRMGVGLAIILRLLLLVAILAAIEKMQAPFFTYGLRLDDTVEVEKHPANNHVLDHPVENWVLTDEGNIFAATFNVHSIVVLVGGIFIIYTAFKEIMHMLRIEHDDDPKDARPRSVGAAIFWIVLMNLVFSFDSILSAIALTHNIWIMGTAIVASGIMMIGLADRVAAFLERNRMFEVLGLFILFIVGVLLVSEGAHLAHLYLFGYEIQPMAKATFYFVIGILIVVDLIQSKYQKKLLAREHGKVSTATA